MGNKWPKAPKVLTEEQIGIRNLWMIHWHEIAPNKFSLTEKFNHIGGFLNIPLPPNCKTLEVGAGLGSQVEFEDLTKQEYYALDLRSDMLIKCKERFPQVNIIKGDIIENLDLPKNYFNRVVAIHVLEHLLDLPKALNNIYSLLTPLGFLEVIIPLEGSTLYSLARRVSSQKEFEKKFKVPYNWCIESEHVNSYKEILEELDKYFIVTWKKFFPINIPIYSLNLTLGLRCYKKY
jgi:trans-aconitate methyltransferase